MNDFERKQVILKAKIELGPDYEYNIRSGGLGLTLVINAETREKAGVLRKKTPSKFEGLRTLVIYYDTREEKDE